MAVESPLSQDLIIPRNRESSEGKKKLNKKSRSIKLTRVGSLKPSSSRKSKSRFTWVSSIDFSDSLPNYMKATNSSDAKTDKDNISQGGSEIDDSASVSSSNYGSFVTGLPKLNQTSRVHKMNKTYGSSRSFRRRAKSRITQPCVVSSDDAATPQSAPSAQGSDGFLSYLKATSSSDGRKKVSSLASLENLESSTDSSDHSSSKFKSGSSGHKSPQTLVRTPSVKVIMNKTSFKPKRSSVKCSAISEGLNVGRGTCSSILKGKRFSQRVELNSEPTEVEQSANAKVCPYHHCSLHGHHHDPASQPKRSLFMKRQSLKSRKSLKPVSESISGVKFSGSREKDLPTSQVSSEPSQEVGHSSRFLTALKNNEDMGFSIEIHAKLRAHVSGKADGETKDAKAIGIHLGESSYQVQSPQKSLNDMMFSLVKTISDLKEKTEECNCRTEKQKSSLVASTKMDPNVREVTAPNIGYGVQESTTGDTNADHSVSVGPDDHASTCADNEANLVGQSWKGKHLTMAENSDDFGKPTEDKSASCSTLDHNSLDELKTSTGEKNHSTDLGDILVTGSTQVGGGSDASKLALEGDSQSTGALEGNRPQLKKDKPISMWHLIHKHMASSLAPDSDTKLHKRADEGEKVLPEATISETKQSSSDLNVNADSHDATYQDIELCKVFAIKLVREAIEKILLPEVPDQSSDEQSVTSDAVSEQDILEKHHSDEFIEDGIREEFEESKEENDVSANLKEAGQNADDVLGVEKEKTGSRLKKDTVKKAPKHWSNLKKWIILQRFVKALEKVRKFNPVKAQHLQLEPDPEAEKVSLRHQTSEDRKKAEEWMFDYALQQAINQLAPTQKKKVALLVKAFETVVPPQEDSGMHLTFPKLKEAGGESPFSRKNVDESTSQRGNRPHEDLDVSASVPDKEEKLTSDNSLRLPTGSTSEVPATVCSKPYDTICPSPEQFSEGENQKQDILKTDAPKESVSRNKGNECSREGNGGAICVAPASSPAANVESEPCSETTSSVPEIIPVNNSITSSEEPKEESKMANVNLEIHEDVTSSLGSEFPTVGPVSTNAASGKPADSSISESDVNHTEKDKKSHIRMWHMVYQHVVSNIAEKFGPKLLDGSDDEPEDANKSSATTIDSGFSRSEAIKIVQEAVDEILLPEIQDDISETESVTSDVVPYQELTGKNHSEGGDRNAFSSPVLTGDDVDNSREKQADERRKSLVEIKTEPPKPKNWSKLRKMILLKRSIKALEKARTLKPQSQKNQALGNADSEKVDLRHQMMNERKKAEQWMLDYAVQNIVYQLTPARKGRVSMLVEAFEAVVPLPEI